MALNDELIVLVVPVCLIWEIHLRVRGCVVKKGKASRIIIGVEKCAKRCDVSVVVKPNRTTASHFSSICSGNVGFSHTSSIPTNFTRFWQFDNNSVG